MKLTAKQRAARLKPHRVNGRWFYLGDGRGVEACSFHAPQTAIYGIPVQVLLRALEKCGYLDQWEKQKT